MARLKYVKARGAMGLYYGMGIDDIDINFENISGLVTLAGENGHGKTTLMELCSPYPTFKSKEIKDPKQYNFKKQFRLRDSYKEVCYVVDGHEYVFRLEIPAGTKTTPPEGYITRDGEPLTKGKITEYKKVVNSLFGSERMFYSSLFSCQGGQKLTDLKPGEFKSLIIELLGLSRYEEYWHNIKKCLDECNQELAIVDRGLSKYEDLEKTVNELKSQEARLQETISAKATIIKEADTSNIQIKKTITDKQEELARARENDKVIEQKKEAYSKLLEQKEALNQEGLTAAAELGVWLKEHQDNLKPHMDLIAQEADIVNSSMAMDEVRKEEAIWNTESRAIMASKEASNNRIEYLTKALNAIDRELNLIDQDPELKTLEDKYGRLREDAKENRQKHKELSDNLTHLQEINQKQLHLFNKEIGMMANAKSLLDNRPEGCTNDDCPFIADALSQAKKIKILEGKITIFKAESAENEANLTAKVDEMDTLFRKIVEMGENAADDVKNRKNILEKRRKTILRNQEADQKSVFFETAYRKTLNDRYTEIAGYLDGIPSRMKTLEELANKSGDLDAAKKIMSRAETEVSLKQKDVAKKSGQISDKIEDISSGIQRLALEIKAAMPPIPIEDLEDDIQAKIMRLEFAQKKNDASRAELAELDKQLAIIRDRLENNDNDLRELAVLQARKEFILGEIKRWSYIRDAVSKSGLQALEISSAAPMLTAIANDLLHTAFGGEFYVDLITEDPETGAEILEIMVTREDGETFPLSTYSGGEAVWLLQAFKCAQILVNTEKSGILFETCFADEESGALDKKKAERFIKMYRALMEKGHFEKLLYITHIPECQAMADHVITFQEGGIVSNSDLSAA